MRIITGRTGEPHITPEDDAIWHREFQKFDTCFFKSFEHIFECEVLDNSTVRIYDGFLSIQGRFMCINKDEWDDVTIEPADIGMLRKDVIVAKLEIDDVGISTASTVVIKGEEASADPVAPIIPETDLDDGDKVAYIGLATVDISGANITNATTLVGRTGVPIIDSKSGLIKKYDLLWENASPFSSFVGQNVTLQKEYNINDTLIIEFSSMWQVFSRKHSGPEKVQSILQPVSKCFETIPTTDVQITLYAAEHTFGSSIEHHVRSCGYHSQNRNIITFGNGTHLVGAGGSTIENNLLVPTKIYRESEV